MIGFSVIIAMVRAFTAVSRVILTSLQPPGVIGAEGSGIVECASRHCAARRVNLTKPSSTGGGDVPVAVEI